MEAGLPGGSDDSSSLLSLDSPLSLPPDLATRDYSVSGVSEGRGV